MSVCTSAKRFITVAAVVSLATGFGGNTPALASPTMPSPGSAENEAGQPHAAGPLGPLIDLAIGRLLVSDQVAASKFGTGTPIDDPVREHQELTQVRRDAVELGIDPDATVAFFADQITASKVVQKGLFARWTRRPDLAPVTKPDLDQIRVRLDQITAGILRQLLATQRLRNTTAPCRVDLTVARVSGEVLNRLDGLHRHALSRALRSVC